MPVEFACPHCEYEIRVEKLRPDGTILCAFCAKAVSPPPGAIPAAAPESDLPVAEVVRPRSAVSDGIPAADWEEMGEPEAPLAAKRLAATRLDDSHGNPWYAFGCGSGLASRGILFEVVAITIIFLAQVILVAAIADAVPNRLPEDATIRKAHKFVSIVGVGIALIGTFLVTLGRTGQASIPSNRMESLSSLSVAVLSWINAVGFALSVGLFALNEMGSAPAGKAPDEYSKYAFLLIFMAFGTRWFADTAGMINLGLVGGAMQSRSLRDRVAMVSLVFQLIGLGYLLLVVVGFLKTLDTPTQMPVPTSTQRTGPPAPRFREEVPTMMMVGMAVIYGVTLAYLLLNFSLHTAAKHAALAWVENPDDE